MCKESAFYQIFRKLKINEIYIIDNYIKHYCTSLLLYKPNIIEKRCFLHSMCKVRLYAY